VIRGESPMWTQDLLERVLDVTFTQFKKRSVGLALFMTYSLAQKTPHLLKLTWDDVSEDCTTVTVNGLDLPVSEPLLSMLRDQKELWDFQRYVLPYHRTSDNAYRPIPVFMVRRHLRDCVELVEGLDGADLLGLRNLAITEMLDAQIDPLYILYVTGRKDVRFLQPLMNFDRENAKTTFDKRLVYLNLDT